MKHIIPKQKPLSFNNSIEHLHNKTHEWISEIEFIKVEQDFLKELLAEHIMGLCDTNNFSKGKLYLNGINHEAILGETLIESINDHKINLALLIENIYIKRENLFRDNHEFLKNEVQNYIENFKYIKKQVFELILFIMKKEKQQKLLAK
ncbi:hypothetical protein [uncultured Lutibacter sp.]|uniref:hypothetical protein n=1 Tax=uncultured Lutibacter sp. TaxID=437739 RepID=UPI0026023DDC|nr:hypothetical protein [uncultured Lutibacter sp.]